MTAGAKPLFKLLLDYEQRSIRHDAGGVSQRDRPSKWDGVVFRLADYQLTCAIDAVDEILPFSLPTPVPGAKEWLLGLANVRGNLVTIVDLGWFLFGTRTPVTTRTRLILTRLQGRFVGLMVDEVYGQRHFHTKDLRPHNGEDDLDGLVQGHFPQGENRWGILRLEELMQRGSFIDGAG